MRIHIHLHWLPKAGNRSEEYEDAFWPTRSEVVTGGELRCAVADGATETSFSGQWARQLVRAFGNRDLAERDWTAQLAKEQSRWLHTVQRKPLPWYAEEKARSGAFAAVLGLTLGKAEMPAAPIAGGDRAWTATAIGDCCLFHVRADQLLCSFPAQESTFFAQRPFLLSSNPARNGTLAEQLVVTTGQCQGADTFYLMTDALAHWTLRRCEASDPPWSELAALRSDRRQRRFGHWIAALRAAGTLRNDDVTLLTVHIQE